MFDFLAHASTITAIALAALAGLVRGTTGFGGALVMTAPLGVLVGPQVAVPVTLLLESLAATPMLPAAWRAADWRTLRPLALAAACCVPLGAWFLAEASGIVARRTIALVVIAASLLLLAGARYRGTPGTGASLAVGCVSGTMLGATGIGGPPVILYLLAGGDPAAVTRANLMLYVMLISSVGLASLTARGFLGAEVLALAGAMTPAFLAGGVAGTRLFAKLDEALARRLAMLLMLALGLVALVA